MPHIKTLVPFPLHAPCAAGAAALSPAGVPWHWAFPSPQFGPGSSAATRGPRVPSADGGDGRRDGPGQPLLAPGASGRCSQGWVPEGGCLLLLGMGLPDPTSQPWCVPAHTAPHAFLLLTRDLKYCKILLPASCVLPKELRVWLVLVLSDGKFSATWLSSVCGTCAVAFEDAG